MAIYVIYILSLQAISSFQALWAMQSQNRHYYYNDQLLHSYPNYHQYGHIPVSKQVCYCLHMDTFIKYLQVEYVNDNL